MVVQGRVTFTIDDETRELGPGGTWRIPSGAAHHVDVGPDGAVVIDIFAPTQARLGCLAVRTGTIGALAMTTGPAPLRSISAAWPRLAIRDRVGPSEEAPCENEASRRGVRVRPTVMDGRGRRTTAFGSGRSSRSSA